MLETRLSIHERREMELTERLSTTLDSSASVTDLTVDDAATPERTAPPPLTKGDSTASGGDGLVDEKGYLMHSCQRCRGATGMARA